MGNERRSEAVIEELEEQSLEQRRHRPASELRLPEPQVARFAVPDGGDLPPADPRRARLDDDLRAALWSVVRGVLFDAGDRAALLKRVWGAPPIGALVDRFPEDGAAVIERWFTLVEPADVFRFLESVHEGLDPSSQSRFAAATNAAFERGSSDHRFVARRIAPVGSRSDAAAIERALTACKTAHWAEVEIYLLDAIAYLAEKPTPDTRESVQAAARAVQHAAVALTHEQYLDFDDALADLETKGHMARTLRAAYAGLVAYGNQPSRKTTEEEARLVLVTCAAFVSHLASRAT